MSLTSEEKMNIQTVWNGLDAILVEKSESGIEQNFAEDFGGVFQSLLMFLIPNMIAILSLVKAYRESRKG